MSDILNYRVSRSHAPAWECVFHVRYAFPPRTVGTRVAEIKA